MALSGSMRAITWNVKRGVLDDIHSPPWQTCTCIGNWHYDRGLYERNGYKSAKQVTQILADVVSKNGTLLLNVPVRGDALSAIKRPTIADIPASAATPIPPASQAAAIPSRPAVP